MVQRRYVPHAVLIVSALLCAGSAAARALLPAGDGLLGRYYANPEMSGVPLFSATDPRVSTAQVERRWGGAAPSAFSVVWTGYLTVARSGTYTFASRSDDGSRIFIGRELVVDNSGNHGPATQTGRVTLTRGPHPLRVEYVQSGGAFAVEWFWADGEGTLETVPWWMLSRRRTDYPTVVAARVSAALRDLAAAVFCVCAVWMSKRRWHELTGTIALAIVAAAALPGDPIIRTSEYEYQVHLSALRHLRWGVDVAPTYGPWGFVGIPLYNPTTFLPMALINAVLVGFTALRVFVFVRRIRPQARNAGLWAAAALLPLTVIPVAEWSAALFSFQIIALAMSVEWLCLKRPAFDLIDAFSAIALGFLSLVKISVWPLLPLLVIGAWVQSRRQAMTLTTCVVASAAAGWLAARQSLGDVPAFMRLSADVIVGYKNGLALWHWSAAPSTLFVTAAVLMVVALIVQFPQRDPAAWLVWLVPAAVCVQLFQAAFVRPDGHHIVPNVLALATVGVMVATATLRQRALVSAMLTLGLVAIFPLLVRASPGSPYYGRPAMELRGLLNLAADGVTQLDVHRATVFARLRAAFPLPPEATHGTFAVWAGDIGVLEAYDVPFVIQPTFTSYAAYTRRLEQANAGWIEHGEFDWMLWCGPATVDDRYPSETDSLALLSLAARFVYHGPVRGCALLRRRTPGLQLAARDTEEHRIGFGAPLQMRTGQDSLVWAEISVPRTFLGTVMGTTLKPVPVLLSVVLRDGTTVRHPITPSLTVDGFLLSPYARGWDPIAAAAEGGQSGKEVVALQLERWALGAVSSDRFYRSEATVRLTTFSRN